MPGSKSSLREMSDLLAVVALAFLAFLAGLLPPTLAPLRFAFGLLLATFLPGYALVAVIFARVQLGAVEWLVLTIALSISVLILTGVSLNGLRWELGPGAWRIALLLVVLAGAALAAWRRATAGLTRPPIPAFPHATRDLALFSAATVLLGLALGIGGVGGLGGAGSLRSAELGSAVRTEPFTQLWALPRANGGRPVIEVGILNEEETSGEYRIVALSGGAVLADQSGIVVPRGQEWRGEVLLSPGRPGAPISVLLYRAGEPDRVYRSVRIAPDAVWQQ